MKIDTNIPRPTKRTSAKRGQCKYPFATMKVGQSFVVEDEKKRYSIGTLAKRYGDQQNPIKVFSVQKDSEGVMRCWRDK